MRTTDRQLFKEGQRYTKAQVIDKLNEANRKRARLYLNIYGWDVYFTISPTIATPTGLNKRFPRTCYIYNEH